MKRLLWAAVVVVCLSGAGRAESRPGTWLRRLTMAGACAASFWDLQTTRAGAGYGALESNRLLADERGRPQWGRTIGIKVGVCAATALAQEWGARSIKSPAATYVWTGMNAALAARFVSTSLSNRRVTGKLKRAPSAPAYLLNPDN